MTMYFSVIVYFPSGSLFVGTFGGNGICLSHPALPLGHIVLMLLLSSTDFQVKEEVNGESGGPSKKKEVG